MKIKTIYDYNFGDEDPFIVLTETKANLEIYGNQK